MPAITTETLTTETLEMPAASEPKTAEDIARIVKHYTDQDPTLYPEAVAHILTPNRRRRTTVSSATFAAIKRALEEE